MGYKFSTYVEGWRWQNIEEQVENLAHAHGLYVETRAVNNFLKKTVYLHVRGEYDDVSSFGHNLINEYPLHAVGVAHFALSSRINKADK